MTERLSHSNVNEYEETDIEISHIEVIASRQGKDLREVTWVKIVVLLLVCNIVIGLFYCYDIPGILNR